MSRAFESDSTLSTYTASDGDNLAVQDWPLPEGLAPRGMVVLVHGLGEHAGRYDALARRLNRWGFVVRGYDQYGHGESDGARGGLPRENRLVDDLADVIASSRARLAPGAPLVVLGHSMGGLVAACLVSQGRTPVDGLVLSSPALDAGLTAFEKLLLRALLRLAPDFRVSNGIDPDFLSQDSAVVAAYLQDPRVHDRISPRLARFMAEAGPRVLAAARDWKVPTLLMYGGADKVVNPAGSRAFAAAAPAQAVRSCCFGDLFHEIFNEPESEAVFETLAHWLDERF
jgi:alpha-beta hydrolase superfamily lysophospholipase